VITFGSGQAIEYIADNDPAIDKDSPAFNREAFERTGDRVHLPAKSGAVPRVFKLRRLTRKQFFRVMGLGMNDQFVESCAYGIVGIDPAGDFSPEFKSSDIGQRMTDASIDKLYDLVGPLAIVAVGTAIFTMAKPDPT